MSGKNMSKALQKETENEEEIKKKSGLGVFGTDDLEDQESEKDDERIKKFDGAMGEKPLIICGIPIRPIRLSSFALLRQIDSAFLTFTPLLSPDDRKDYQELVEKAQKTNEELQRLTQLSSMARAEAAMLPNPFMECLKFMALMTVEIDEDEAETLAFDTDPKDLRKRALAFGERLDPSLIDPLSNAIGDALAEAQSDKVVPKKKGARNIKSKKATRRRGSLS